jgi:uncharacterized protein YjcR
LGRSRSPDREKAFEIYKECNGNIDLVEIASQLNLPAGTIRGWKNKDKWDERLNGTLQKNTERSKRKQGGQPNNKNAQGYGAPVGNKNAETHGFFSKYLPEETLEIMQAIQVKDPLDILWENITIQYAAIVRAQKIMYVRDINDKTTTKIEEKEGNVCGERWEVQQAWDKQANFLQAQSRAMTTLQGLLKRYDEMLLSGLANEEQKLRIEKLKADINILKGGGQGNSQEGIDNFIKATTMSTEEIKAMFEGEDDEDIQEES